MLRPQPIGIFPLPANFLLVPETLAEAVEYENLLNGVVPEKASFYKSAIEGDREGALAALAADHSPEARFNRFVLSSSPEGYRQLKAELDGPLEKLLDAAAYTLNYLPEPPDEDGLDGELLAFVRLARASHRLENDEPEAALDVLRSAADAAKNVSPVLYGQILASLAETRHQFAGADPTVAQTYKTALDALKKSELEPGKAALNMNLGICYQELSAGNRGALLEAVKCYQEALKYFTREDFPEEFAFAQNNLALAYLSMPMTEASDKLRVAIAIQALREALKVYRKETHGELWASTQLNLANALQYAPSSHVAENLQEAVNLYEEILSVRQPAENPAGYARLLANQGNALAHLGIFDHALPKLTEARAIFDRLGETDSAASIDEVLAEIEDRKSAAAAR
ncbi:MAG: hypothetical protein JSS81_08325 [Acidobacteria bacterium]|nr:hypothetical protein [Acidobacteriota bacterium]